MRTLLVNLFLAFSLALVCNRIQGQDFKQKSKIIYGEAFGSTGNSFSINFENTFLNTTRICLGYRIGIGGLMPVPRSFVMPAGMYMFTGKKRSHFDLTAGLSLLHGTRNLLSHTSSYPDRYNTSLMAPVLTGTKNQKVDYFLE